MHRVTRKSIKDSDIDLARVEKRLSEIEYSGVAEPPNMMK